jgi:hypothetical protein
MAYDSARDRIVMFGGSLGNDTWEWDGTDWSQVVTATTPPARSGHSMAYDMIRGKIVLFGGTANPILPPALQDTWEYDGVDWTLVNTSNAPSEAVDTAMCYDLAQQACVLYGGTSFFGAPDQKTWHYNGTNWTDVSFLVGHGPTSLIGLGVSNAAIVYDLSRGQNIIYGGRTPNGTFSTETWAYDGSPWALVANGSPGSRTGFQMTIDTLRNRVVLYGGSHGNLQTHYNETWEFEGAPAASYSTFGTGCAGSADIPALAPVTGSLPRSGQNFAVELTNLPPAGGVGFALLAMGLGNTTWSGLPLPLDLGPYGMPTCLAYIRVDGTVLLSHSTGTASHGMTIPTGFDGVKFYQQGFAIDPQAGNPIGATVSNAGEAVIGS